MSLVFFCQSFVRLPASFTPAVCQSHLQCESDGLQGFGCPDSPFRVHEHPHQTGGSTAQSRGALLSQPAPRTAAANQSYSRESTQHRQVRLKRSVYSFITQFQALKSRCVSIPSARSADLCKVVSRVDASLWLVTETQRCPLVRAAYIAVADSLRRFCCETYLSKLRDTLIHDLQTPQRELQVCDTHAAKVLGPESNRGHCIYMVCVLNASVFYCNQCVHI